MAAVQVTLTTADTNYNLLTLVRAIESGLADGFRHVVVQSDSDNGAAVVRLGSNSQLANDRFGYSVLAGEGQVYPGGGGGNRYFLKGLYARTDTNGSKLNLELSR